MCLKPGEIEIEIAFKYTPRSVLRPRSTFLLRSFRVHSAAWLAEDDEVGQVVDNGAVKIEGPPSVVSLDQASEAYVRVT